MSSPKRPLANGILHRVAIVTLGLACAAATAQQPRKTSPGPRALGVLVMPKAAAGAKKPPQLFLIPIALWYQNRYFDAQVYEARPQPMALEGGVVYEIRRGGEALGLFTIDSIAQQENKKWLGGGQYQTMKDIEARAAARRERNKAPTEVVKDDGPPRLLRRDKSSTPSPAPSEPVPSASAPVPATPTTKTEPAPEKKPEAAPAPKPAASDDDDPDRPRLHRAPGGEAQTIAPAIKPSPTLGVSAKNAAAPGSPASAAPAGPAPDVFVAISDVKTGEPHSYEFAWSADEKEAYTKAASQLANAAIADFLQRRYHVQPAAPAAPKAAPRSRTRAAAPPAPAVEPLDNVQVRALDVETNNYPEIVFSAQRTAQVPGPDGGTEPRTVFVTLVMRVDTMAVDKRDQYRTLLTSVTDDRHMDEQPRLELIDTVDTDGDGIGKLLFREVFSPSDERNPEAWGFAFFRVGVDRLQRLYDTEGKID